VLLKGLETLELRVRKHCDNTREIADFMVDQKGVERVLFPGHESHPQHQLAKRQMDDFGSIICLYIEGGKQGAFNFMNAFRLIDISNNLGDTKSLATHPATTTHQRLKPEERQLLGITDGLVRISVGLEDVEDIKEDLAQALAKLG
jgi:O-succinylhomoserine sulfhydrylase